MSKIQNESIKSEADITGAGGTKSQLINDTKIYVTANSLNKRLDEAITANDFSGGAVLDTVVTKTANYTALTSDDVILCDVTSGGLTVDLFTAVGNSGRQLVIKKTDSSFNHVTIDAFGSQTIDETALFILLATEDESVTIVSNGSNWYIKNRYIRSVWKSYTPTLVGFGTTTGQSFFWRRSGDSIQINGKWTNGTVTGVEGRIPLPAGLTSSDSGKLPSGVQVVGHFVSANGAQNNYTLLIEQSSTYMTYSRASLTKSNGNSVNDSEAEQICVTSLPIANWDS